MATCRDHRVVAQGLTRTVRVARASESAWDPRAHLRPPAGAKVRLSGRRARFILGRRYDPCVDASGVSDADRILDGLRLFNEHHFFEAHEVLEDVWHREHGEPRLFLQGLIQICAGFHHYQNGNARGAVELLQRGADKMRKYPRRYLGLDAERLLTDVDACRIRIARMHEGLEPETAMDFPRIPIPDQASQAE